PSAAGRVENPSHISSLKLPTEHRHEGPGDPEEERAEDCVDEVHRVVGDVDLQAAEDALDVRAEKGGNGDDGEDVRFGDDDRSDEAAEVAGGDRGADHGDEERGEDAGERAFQ